MVGRLRRKAHRPNGKQSEMLRPAGAQVIQIYFSGHRWEISERDLDDLFWCSGRRIHNNSISSPLLPREGQADGLPSPLDCSFTTNPTAAFVNKRSDAAYAR